MVFCETQLQLMLAFLLLLLLLLLLRHAGCSMTGLLSSGR
jgi:hypothetical protein